MRKKVAAHAQILTKTTMSHTLKFYPAQGLVMAQHLMLQQYMCFSQGQRWREREREREIFRSLQMVRLRKCHVGGWSVVPVLLFANDVAMLQLTLLVDYT